MAVTFGELTKKTVHIGIGGDAWIEVPMLTVADYGEYSELLRRMSELNDKAGATDAERVELMIRTRNEMVRLAKKVMPEEFHESLERMELDRIVRLVGVLCTGKDNSDEDDPQKKTTMPSQVGR